MDEHLVQPERTTGGELPGGTVTVMFTDVAGSTELLRRLGDDYERVLLDHEAVLAAAITEYGGRVVDRHGDSLFAGFPRARDAVGAAVAIQRTLATHPWPEGGAVRVRIGLHTGEPALGEDRYVGLDVHRAARVMEAGHGGQVLLSSATRGLVEDDLPPGFALQDLGTHRLKDFPRRERLFQLVGDGLARDFPALKTLDAHRRRRRLMLAAAALVVVGAGLVAAILAERSSPARQVPVGAVGWLDPHSGRVLGSVPIGPNPGPIVVGHGSVWVGSAVNPTVTRLALDGRSAARPIPISTVPDALAYGSGGVWVAGNDGSVVQLAPEFDAVVERRRLDTGDLGFIKNYIAVGSGAVWATSSAKGELYALDPRTLRVKRRIDLPATPTGVAVGSGVVWVTSDANSITQILARVGQPEPKLTVGSLPTAPAVGFGSVWFANENADTVSELEPRSTAVRTITVGAHPVALAIGEGAVWVANADDGTVSRIDPRTYAVRTVRLGVRPGGIAVGGGRVWVSGYAPLNR